MTIAPKHIARVLRYIRNIVSRLLMNFLFLGGLKLGLPSIRTDKWTKRFIGLYILGFTMAMFQTAYIVWEIRKSSEEK
jgi:NADH:ubiquinone oxidoreductase subunit H